MASSDRFKLSGFALSVLAATVLLAVLVIGLSSLRGADADGAAPAIDPLPVRTLTTEYLDRAVMQVRYPGLVTARRESVLGFETGGRLDAIHADIGDRVREGDLLAELDTRALQARLASARAEAEASRTTAELANLTLERQRTLLQQGHVSRQRLDEAEASARAARARAEAAEAGAAQLEVQLDLARLEAPFDGVVTARAVDEGAVAAPGSPVLTLIETGAPELRVGIPPRDSGRLTEGETYEVEIEGRVYTARLRATTGIVDRASRSVTAVFDFEPDQAVMTGEVARLILPAPLETRGFWAPVTALAEGRRGLWSVYALTGEGIYTLEPRPVEILHTEETRVYLTGAVEEGTQILASGLQRVTPGQSVVPVSGED